MEATSDKSNFRTLNAPHSDVRGEHHMQNPIVMLRGTKRKKCPKLSFATWNVKTLLDSNTSKSITVPRKTALVARELNKYNIDVTSLQETRLKETGQLEEVGEGYTYFWSGCGEDEANNTGVAICVKTKLYKQGTISEPTCVNDRLMYITIHGKESVTP